MHSRLDRDRKAQSARRLKKRIEEAHRRGAKVDGDVYAARLELELGVIKRMQFPGYFLIVWDFIRHAKEKGIPCILLAVPAADPELVLCTVSSDSPDAIEALKSSKPVGASAGVSAEIGRVAAEQFYSYLDMQPVEKEIKVK